MKISLSFIALLVTLLTANPLAAHTSAGHPHSWYALDHILLSLGIAVGALLLFKIVFIFLKKLTSTKALHKEKTEK